MWFKVLCFGLIVSSQILGQNIPFKECYSGPIVLSNCYEPMQMINQILIQLSYFKLDSTLNNFSELK